MKYLLVEEEVVPQGHQIKEGALVAVQQELVYELIEHSLVEVVLAAS